MQRQHPAPRQKQNPTLPMVQLPYYRVRRRHLEAFLARVYGMLGFDFVEAAGTAPGMCPEYKVGRILPPSWDAQRAAERIRHGSQSRNVPLILTTLCADGFIPPGVYVIDTHPEPPPIPAYRTLLLRTGSPDHPECVAFRRDHRCDRAFKDAAAQMDKAAQEQRGGKK